MLEAFVHFAGQNLIQYRYGGDLIILVSEEGLTAVCVWLQRITDLAANYLFWSVSLSKTQVIKMRYLSSLSLRFVFFFP